MKTAPPAVTYGAPADLAVIGGGTAGIVAAKTAAAFGAKVVLIERDRTGGDCLWTGYIIVDKHLRTSNPRIWAAGDLTGHPQFTHTAGAHGSIAATNAILGVRRSVGATVAPRVTFTDPEIAAVGIDPQSAQRIPGLRVVELSHHDLDRAITEADIHGLTQLVLDRGHRIVGAGVVGPRAGETIGEMVLAVNQGLRTRDLAGATHPYPTYNDGPWNASIADVRSQLQGRAVSRLIATIVRLRRRWLRFRADPG